MESTAVEVMELTVTEKSELEELEGVIERGMKSFCEVGRSLLKIRDSRLYRDSHRTFDDYCRDRWGMSRSYAHRMIEAAKTADNLLPIGNTPVNEAQSRPLTRLEPERQREAWKEAVATAPDGKVTTAHVDSVVGRILGKKTITESERVFNEKDSPNLFNLKTLWEASSNRDRDKFIKWLKKHYQNNIDKMEG